MEVDSLEILNDFDVNTFVPINNISNNSNNSNTSNISNNSNNSNTSNTSNTRNEKKKSNDSNSSWETESESDSEDYLTSDDEFDVSQGIVYNVYNNRYIPVKYLGRGTFSRVWLSYDILNNTLCAIKMVFKEYTEDAKDEITRNQRIIKFSKSYPDLSSKILALLLDHFTTKNGQTCLVYEVLGVAMTKLSTFFNDIIPLNIVKKITSDLLQGLEELHTMEMIHTDLKPENILTNIYPRKISFYKAIFVENNFKNQYDTYLASITPDNLASLDKNKRKKIKKTLRNKSCKYIAQIIEVVIEAKLKEASIEFYKENPNVSVLNNEDIGLDITEEDAGTTEIKELDYYTFADYLNEIELSGEQLEIPIKARIIDFGNAEFFGDHVQDEISIRCYRPPENFMNEFYNEKADIWSLGCLVYEFLTGAQLFEIDLTYDSDERDRHYLACMESILGKIPVKLCKSCDFSDRLFTKDGNVDLSLNDEDSDSEENEAGENKVGENEAGENKAGENEAGENKAGENEAGDNTISYEQTCISELLIEDFNYHKDTANEIEAFLEQCFKYTVKERISARGALKLPWLEGY